jgi:ATP-dependent helicase HrpA
MQSIEPTDAPIHKVVSERLFRMTGVRVPDEEWPEESLTEHLRFRYEVVDDSGKVVASGRDVDELIKPANDAAQSQAAQPKKAAEKVINDTQWVFDDLPEFEHHIQAGIKIQMYPALVDKVNSVSRERFTSASWAEHEHQLGLWRLAFFAYREPLAYLAKKMPKYKESALLFAPYGKADLLKQDILMGSVQATLANGTQLPRTRVDFMNWLEAGRAELIEKGEHLALQVHDQLLAHHKVRKQLKGKVSFATAFMFADVASQLDNLIYPGYVSQTQAGGFGQLLRYLQGAEQRLNRSSGVPASENMIVDELNEFWQRFNAKYKASQQMQQYLPDLMEYRWMLEEYRVSLFAQKLGTRFPVSAKRIEKQWQKVIAQ